MKKGLSVLLDKWWIIPLLSLGIIFLLFYFNSGNIWLIGLSILILFFSTTRLLIIKKRTLGFLSGLILTGVITLSLILYSRHHIVPGQAKIHEIYANKYENKAAVERIIGVEIPDFKIINTNLTHYQISDFEFETNAEIEFDEPLSEEFFHQLDSITQLPQPDPESIDKKSNYFYNSLESIGRSWSKEGDTYQYKRVTDFGEYYLHSTDSYFYFTVDKGSRSARLKYGNY